MLSLGEFPPPPPLCNTATHKPTNQYLPFPIKTHQTHLNFVSARPTHHGFGLVLRHMRSEFCVFALKNQRKGGNTLSEVDGFGDEEEDDDEEEEYNDDGDGDYDDEEEVFVPLRNMKKWVKNKPRGFGDGKEYDTSIEDNLFDEMLQSRQAQLANIKRLKSNPESANSNKGIYHKKKALEDVPAGFRVRLVNLPKKKNIHRDLQLAFKGIPGIVNIIPAVFGNKKTRDPICKGLAFVDLKSEEDANRFVEKFSRQSISFGKIQKLIKCEIMNSKSPSSYYEQTAYRNYNAPRLAVLGEEDPDADCDVDDISPPSSKLIASDESEDADEYVPAQWDDVSENLGSFSLGTRSESALDSNSSKQEEKVRANDKKPEAKRKKKKVPNLNIPGSAKRLRIREKAALAGALSKYAVQACSAKTQEITSSQTGP